MARTSSLIVIIISVLAFTCINAQVACGNRTCVGSATDQCCNDFVMGPTCYNPSTYTCAPTTTSAGASGSRLCGSNEGACGSACYSKNGYYCCNGVIKQSIESCSSPTNSPTSASTSSPTSAPVKFNCPNFGNQGGVNCSDPSLCCGAGTIQPSCLPADGSKKCCVHYKGATQCNQDQVCGGSGGPGASSYAQCGPAGSTFCDKGDGQGAFCTAAQPTCCGYYGGYGFCCAAGCACNNTAYTCSCPSTPASTTTAPITAAPTTVPPPQNNCKGAGNSAGVNCSDPSLCCGYGTITPSCLPADGSKKCCTHYLASTQCDPTQTCGGSGGPGASSYAQCGAPGTTFCDKGTGQGAFCTAAQPTCCGYNSGFGFCCAPGCACNNSYYTCSCPSSSTTIAPTKAPTNAPAPTTFAVPTTVMPSCPSGQALCGGACYDYRSQFCCGNSIVCGSGQSCNIGQAYSTCCNHTLSYCGVSSFGVKCYDPATQTCCGAAEYMPTVCPISKTCRIFPTAGCE